MSCLKDQLLAKGFPQTEDTSRRVDHVSEVLQRNGIYCVTDLDGVGEVSCFDYFSCGDLGTLTVEESHFIENLAKEASALGQHRRQSTAVLEKLSSTTLLSSGAGKAIEIVHANPGAAWDSAGNGPRQAIKGLKRALQGGLNKHEWLEKARVSAVLGSCPGSHKSLVSGLRCWVDFAQQALGRGNNVLPPHDTRATAMEHAFSVRGYLRQLRGLCKDGLRIGGCAYSSVF